MEKFKNKYRIKLVRHPNWDYGQNAKYFITICTANRKHFFGKIANKKMQLTHMGEIATNCWAEIASKYPYVVLHNYIEMPNHVHGIIEIAKPCNKANTEDGDGMVVKTRLIASPQYNKGLIESPQYNKGLIESPQYNEGLIPSPLNNEGLIPSPLNKDGNEAKKIGGITGDKNPMLHENIARIIRWYKGACTYKIRKTQANFAWQSRYHDSIIRSEQSFHRVQNYIAKNPLNWKDDTFHR